MLSAQSNIPQTILFGRSPVGMNSTGESDLENYYNSVEHIQTKMLYRNFKKTIDLILLSMLHKGEIEELLDSIPAEDLFDNYTENNTETEGDTSNSGNIFEKGDFSQFAKDGSDETPTAAAVIVVNKDGYVLCGVRSDNGLICGPGGHIEDGEAPIQAAIREAQEEFNITPTFLVPLTVIGENKDGQHKTSVFLCKAFEGKPKCDEKEMHSALLLPADALLEHFADKLFAPFKESLLIFQNVAQTGQHSDIENSDESGIINDDEFKESDHPRDENGQFTDGGGSSSSSNTTPEEDNVKSEANRKKLYSRDDPMEEIDGAGEISHPEEIKAYRAEISECGAELEEVDDKEKIGYEPSPTSGRPGKVCVSKGSSFGAWTHEIQHMRDDRDSGWKGFRIIENPDEQYRFEKRAYEKEIELAKAANRPDIVKRLEENLEKERRKIYGEEPRD